MSEQTPGRDPWLGGETPPAGPPAPAERQSPGPDEWPRQRPDTDATRTEPKNAPRVRPPEPPRRSFDRDSRPGSGPPRREHRRSGMRAIERVRRDATSDTWRLFIAVELSPAAIAEIAGFINDMPPGPAANVRWTPRDNVHLTLQFLGDTDPGIVGQVQRSIAAEAANTAPMLLALGETGAFPELRNPRILWVGLTGDIRRLVQLQGRLEGAMREFEYEPERKSFTPHITVGRAARDLDSQQAGDIGFSWRRSKMPRERAQIPVREVVLYRSRLQLGGPTYEKIFTAKLGG